MGCWRAIRSVCFNGAARRSARKASTCSCAVTPTRHGFNGAARRSARKGKGDGFGKGEFDWLQRSRAPERAEGDSSTVGRRRRVSFNGAARRSARKGNPSAHGTSTPAALQRSRAPERAEGARTLLPMPLAHRDQTASKQANRHITRILPTTTSIRNPSCHRAFERPPAPAYHRTARTPRRPTPDHYRPADHTTNLRPGGEYD